MTEPNDANVAPKADVPQKQTPGNMLCVQRESMGLTQQAVSEALHLTVHYIKSLENDDYAKLPGLTFVKGYFRSYARFLRMDVDAVLACYERHLATLGLRQHAHDFNSVSIGSIGGRSRSDQSFAWALVAGVILVIALAAGWWFFGREMEIGVAASTPRTPAPATQNAAQNTATPAAVTQQNRAPQGGATPTQTTLTPSAAQNSFTTSGSLPQGSTQTLTQTPASATATPFATSPGAAVDSTTQAADAGVAVINATLEARQEAEALAANNAQAAGIGGVNADPNAVVDGTAAAQNTAPAATGVQTSTTTPSASTTATPLSSYTAPAAGDATSAAATTTVGGTAPQMPVTSDTLSSPTTIIDTNGQEVTTEAGGTRVITLRGVGNDRFEIQLNGSSWAEIRDAQGADLFSNMLSGGDRLIVEGTAPFAVLLGDARNVQASFNAQTVDLSTLTRTDNTARFRLGAEGITAILREQPAQATATE